MPQKCPICLRRLCGNLMGEPVKKPPNESMMQKNEQDPVRVASERRNRDLDPQLVRRGKDEQD